jgi:membrane protease YdiL (CAAX protease family)
LFTIGIVPLSILHTWAYNRNGQSILAAILVHFAYNFVLGLVHPFSATTYLWHVVTMSIAALAVVLVSRPNVTRSSHAAPRGVERWEGTVG